MRPWPILCVFAVGCSGSDLEPRSCPEGSIVAVEGCIPIPDRPFPPYRMLDGGTDGGVSDGGGPTSRLSGTWAAAVIVVQSFNWQPLGISGQMQTDLRFSLDVSDDGQQIRASGSMCSITTTSDELALNLEGRGVDVFTISWQGASPSPGNDFVLTPITLTAGWTPDTLPSQASFIMDPTDPRVTDSDSDGAPGVSYQMASPQGDGRVFAATRQLLSLSGTMNVEGSMISGTVGPLRELYVLGSEAMPATAVGPITFLPVTDPNQRFVWQKSTPDEACATAATLSP